MHFSKTASFSPNNKYFACVSDDDKLLVWETSSSILIDCNFNANVNGSCTSLNWYQTQQKYASLKKAKLLCNSSSENILLAVGTLKGDILLYNIPEKNLYMHLTGRHSDAVNDLSFYNETNSLFSCSSDKSIAILDVSSGKEKSKWEADDSPVFSICVIDENNLLSASSSILWWNVSEKSILKKFIGHSAEIFKLLPVNSVSLNSCYFLSAAVNDTKINAWSTNKSESKTPVASFMLPTQPEVIDISKVFSKDKPLILSAVSKNGFLYLFEHVLNGTVNQPIMPKASLQITSEISKSSVISTRLSSDSESCIVAYGTSQSNMTFKHIKIREALDKSNMQHSTSDKDSLDMSPAVKERSKSVKVPSINGVKSASKPENSSKSTDLGVNSYKRKLRSSSYIDSITESEKIDIPHIEDSNGKNKKQLGRLKDVSSPTDILLEGLETEDDDVIDALLYNSDADFISSSIKNLPTCSLKDFLCKLNRRLEHQQKYSSILSKWLKEILKVHLNYLIQCPDTEEILRCSRKYLNSLKIHETISKLYVLEGLLNFQIQNSSDEESDSENEEMLME